MWPKVDQENFSPFSVQVSPELLQLVYQTEVGIQFKHGPVMVSSHGD